MQTLARLFGRSPFKPLQTHMAKVADCMDQLPPLFEALEQKDYFLVEEISQKICKLEHEADLTKNDIRNNLPSTLFLPIDRASLLEILALQDTIADRAEDLGILLTLSKLEMSSTWKEIFKEFVKKNLLTFEGAHQIILEMGSLLESSFGGTEAEKVQGMVDSVAYQEHEVDLLQRELLKRFFQESEDMKTPHLFLWMKVIQGVDAISDESEKLANRVRMILEVK
ncbi:MAG: TIGR00153 family protein [Chlamydiales bacterium]